MLRPFYHTPVIAVKVKRILPHDPQAFTQGLVLDPTGTRFYESTGLYGKSTIRHVDLATGRVEQVNSLPAEYFGEGLTLFHDRLIQLTWKERTALVYPSTRLRDGPSQIIPWPREGWGLTHNGSELISSDGSEYLYFHDPQPPFRTKRKLLVETWERGRLQSLPLLNSLQYINGYIYANIWRTNRIAVISLQTGIVQQWLDLTALQPSNATSEMVANGIAYHPPSRQLYVTGKYWPSVYEIDLPPST